MMVRRKILLDLYESEGCFPIGWLLGHEPTFLAGSFARLPLEVEFDVQTGEARVVSAMQDAARGFLRSTAAGPDIAAAIDEQRERAMIVPERATAGTIAALSAHLADLRELLRLGGAR